MKVQNSSNPKRQRLTHDKVKAFGNKDTEKKYPIGQDAIDAGLYVIRSYKNFTELDPKGKVVDRGVEDPTTSRIGIYTQSKYNEFIRENEKEGKVNTFHKLLGKYVVLHDPTIEVEETDELAGMTKAELLEMLNGLPATDEELHTAANPATKKADIISLIEKYQNQ